MLPTPLSEAIAKVTANLSFKTLQQASDSLSSRYREGALRNSLSQSASSFISHDHERIAYLLTRLPATYAVIAAVLRQLKKGMPNFAPISTLDIGAGPGTGTWALLEAFPTLQHCQLYERDAGFIALGQKLFHAHSGPKIAWQQTDLANSGILQAGDLSLLSYTLGEMPDPLKVITSVWEKAPILIAIEPGTPRGFDLIRAIRSHLIALGGSIVAPCPHDGQCPMSGGDWCHFRARLERSSLHRQLKNATMSYEDEKFSYVIASRLPFERPQGRLLADPDKHSGHLTVKACTINGLQEIKRSRRHGELYKEARHWEWGDGIELV